MVAYDAWLASLLTINYSLFTLNYSLSIVSFLKISILKSYFHLSRSFECSEIVFERIFQRHVFFL